MSDVKITFMSHLRGGQVESRMLVGVRLTKTGWGWRSAHNINKQTTLSNFVILFQDVKEENFYFQVIAIPFLIMLYMYRLF